MAEREVFWRAAVHVSDGIESYPLALSKIGPAATREEAVEQARRRAEEMVSRHHSGRVLTYHIRHLEQLPPEAGDEMADGTCAHSSMTISQDGSDVLLHCVDCGEQAHIYNIHSHSLLYSSDEQGQQQVAMWCRELLDAHISLRGLGQ